MSAGIEVMATKEDFVSSSSKGVVDTPMGPAVFVVDVATFDIKRYTLGAGFKPKYGNRTHFPMLYDGREFVLQVGPVDSRGGLFYWEGSVGGNPPPKKNTLDSADNVSWAMKPDAKFPTKYVRGDLSMHLSMQKYAEPGTAEHQLFATLTQIQDHNAKLLASMELRYQNGLLFWDPQKQARARMTPELVATLMKTPLEPPTMLYPPKVKIDVVYKVIRGASGSPARVCARLGDEVEFPTQPLKVVLADATVWNSETSQMVAEDALPLFLNAGVNGVFMLRFRPLSVEPSTGKSSSNVELLQADVKQMPPYENTFEPPKRLRLDLASPRQG
jgi:hypothetical protein